MCSHPTPPGVRHTFCILLSGCPVEPISCSREVLYGMLVSITTSVCYACAHTISLLLSVMGFCTLENQICTSPKEVEPGKARCGTWAFVSPVPGGCKAQGKCFKVPLTPRLNDCCKIGILGLRLILVKGENH